MNKKIEKAVDEILILYFSGVPVTEAMSIVLKKLNSTEQFELKELLKKVPKEKMKNDFREV